jgi:glycine cleavage system H protein
MPTFYSDDHTWIRLEDAGSSTAIAIASVGISHHAQDTLGDIVFAGLPQVGTTLAAKDVACAVESVKTAADVYSPAAGTVVETNSLLADNPGLLNTAPEAEGWLFKLQLSQPAQLQALMTESQYTQFLQAA